MPESQDVKVLTVYECPTCGAQSLSSTACFHTGDARRTEPASDRVPVRYVPESESVPRQSNPREAQAWADDLEARDRRDAAEEEAS